jgi:predicted nucleotidyltransferase
MAPEIIAHGGTETVRTIESVTEAVKQFANDVRSIFPVAKAYLFGSWVKGTPKEWSDVDVCFFLKSYGGRPKLDVVTELYLLKRPYWFFIIEPHVFLASHLDQGDPFTREILETGIEI